MNWIDSNKQLPIGVRDFNRLSNWVAVKYYSNYEKKIITACGVYDHEKKEWFVSGGYDNVINKKEVIKWLNEE